MKLNSVNVFVDSTEWRILWKAVFGCPHMPSFQVTTEEYIWSFIYENISCTKNVASQIMYYTLVHLHSKCIHFSRVRSFFTTRKHLPLSLWKEWFFKCVATCLGCIFKTNISDSSKCDMHQKIYYFKQHLKFNHATRYWKYSETARPQRDMNKSCSQMEPHKFTIRNVLWIAWNA